MFLWATILLLAAIDPSTVHICSIAIQDRAYSGIATSGDDEKLQAHLERLGFKIDVLEFRPMADAEHVSRQRGCNYLMYTDLTRAEKTAGAQFSAAMKRVAGKRRGASIYEAELEFRIFRLDTEMPFVSQAVTGRNRSRKLQPRVESRVVSWRVPTGDSLVDAAERLAMSAPPVSTPVQVMASKSVAIESAVERQAKAIEAAFRNPPEHKLAE